MRVLAIDCATEVCSAALFDDLQLVDGACEIIGRGHAERLVPMIAELPNKGRAQRIVVSLGPGSFTGVRIGLAAARALGLAWGAEVLGYPTLHLVAARGQRQEAKPVTVCMNGGHGEYFIQNFSADGSAQDAVRSLPPAEAAKAAKHVVIVGSKATDLADLVGNGAEARHLLPDAREASLLNKAHLTAQLAPIYGRGPDAKLPQARKPATR